MKGNRTKTFKTVRGLNRSKDREIDLINKEVRRERKEKVGAH